MKLKEMQEEIRRRLDGENENEGGYQKLTLKLNQTTLTADVRNLSYPQQVLMVNRIRKHLSVKLKKKTWVSNLWAIPKKTNGGSLRWSTRCYILLD